MRKHDLKGRLKVRKAMNAAISTDTNTDGDIIDLKGYKSVMFTIYCQARSAGTFTPVIQEGDAANLSDAAAVEDTYLHGTEAAAVLDAANEITTIGYTGKRRYVRLRITSSGSAGGTIVATATMEGRRAPVEQGVGA